MYNTALQLANKQLQEVMHRPRIVRVFEYLIKKKGQTSLMTMDLNTTRRLFTLVVECQLQSA